MTTRFAFTILSALAIVSLTVVNIVYAANPAQSTPTAERGEAVDVAPGTKCLVTAALECEIKEITEDAVSISVTAIREAAQGVPKLSKVPYTNRLFKNVGVARTEIQVVLSIPKDRIKQIVPIAEKSSARQEHLQKAVEHLQAAGLDELAGTVAEQANQAARKEPITQESKENGVLAPRRIARMRTEAKEPDAYRQRPVAGGQQQVLVELKVLEVSLSKLREFGLSIGKQGLGGLLRSEPDGDQRGQNRAATVILDRDAAALQFIRRLQEEGLAKTLAEPTLVTLSGRPATFRSGGAFPVPIPQSDGKVAVEYREYGTRVDLVPLYLGNGKLRLEIRPVISQLDPSQSVTVGGTKVPGLRVHTVDATAELMPGQTLVVVGLVQAVPSDAGANKEDPKQESEEIGLIVLATPTLVETP